MNTEEINHKAQSIIEYAAIIIVLAAVFIAMWSYYKRGLMGRYRQAGDVLSAGGLYYHPSSNPKKNYTDRENPFVKY